MKKDLIKTIVIIVLVILLIGIFLIPIYNNQIYSQGFSDGQIDIAQVQTQTGNIFVINNGTIQGYSLNDLCGGLR